MAKQRVYSGHIALLKAAGLRPTRQRLALARLLFERGQRHLTAEQLHSEAAAASNKRVASETTGAVSSVSRVPVNRCRRSGKNHLLNAFQESP